MDIRRLLSYAAVVVIAVWLWNLWMKDYPPNRAQPAKQTSQTQQQTANPKQQSAEFIPPTFATHKSVNHAKKIGTHQALKQPIAEKQLIQVKTNVLEVAINPHGGSIVTAKLLKYPVSLAEKNIPVQILNQKPDKLYVAQSGLTNIGKNDAPETLNFTSTKQRYRLQSAEKQLVVTLNATTTSGLQVVKTYTFTANGYAIKLNYTVTNQSNKSWSGSLYTQLARRKPEKTQHSFYLHSYNGASMSSPQKPYQKVTFNDMEDNSIDQVHQGGWVAFQQHYFLSTWVPQNPKQSYRFYSQVHEPADGSSHIYTIGFASPAMKLAPKATQNTSATLYVGPEIAKNLKALAPGLDHTIDYGWLYPISIIIFWVMSKVYQLVGNWGWSIVITTILIKILFYWFSATSFRSMAKMREVQPRLKALKERFGDDRQALSKATMELYRKEKINPLGGCLPMVIQIPVFIALYYVIIESVQLRQASFIFWIHDLSVKDPYYILPILMGIGMLIQQKLTPTSPDPTQAKIMLVLPVVFTIFFINFPAGLVLYWLVNSVVQTLQQWYVIKTYDSHQAKKKARKERRRKK